MKFPPAFFLAASLFLSRCPAADLSGADLARIGHKVWMNECAGTVSGLTSWNSGEDFASLGIGHFIWYPAGQPGPFEESFPRLVKFLAANGHRVPGWISGPCPWNSRAEFLADASGPRETQLRNLLAETVPLQAQFVAERMRESLPAMLKSASSPGAAEKVRRNFERLRASGPGTFELIDYVNFKGEGTKLTERYNGEGWGLLQVLEGMSDEGDVVRAFAASAREVLARRVRNSPPARNEGQWLKGWDARVDAYVR